MTKKLDIGSANPATYGTQNKWYKATDFELLSNDGKTDIRLDKAMIQMSAYHNAVAPIILAVVVHFTDETGVSMAASITSGTTDDAALEVLLNQWKDNVFMTDFRLCGTGSDETIQPIVTLEADTRRILKPGQKMEVTVLSQPLAAETTKSTVAYIDSIIWYSAAAN